MSDDNDGLAGARIAPTRAQIEALIRAINRDPVSDGLVDRIDALFRPRSLIRVNLKRIEKYASDPAFVAMIDEVALELTKKRADSRSIIVCARQTNHYDDRATLRLSYRIEHERESGPIKTIKGRVVDIETSKPLVGAAVSTGSVTVRTDADGNYSLPTRKPRYGGRKFTVSFEAPGRGLRQAYFSWEELGDATTSDQQLSPASAFGGKVLDVNGGPIAGAELELWVRAPALCADPASNKELENTVIVFTARTNEKGEYAFRNVPPEPLAALLASNFVVHHANFQPREKRYEKNESLGTGWQIRLEAGCELEGVIVDENGKPVANASVRATTAVSHFNNPDVFTDAQGRFHFGSLPEGTAEILAYPREHALAVQNVEVKLGKPATTRIVVNRGDYFEGKVIGEDGRPATTAMVGWLERQDQPGDRPARRIQELKFTHTREDGTFRVGPVNKGRYQITALVEPPRAIANVQADAGAKDLVLELKPDRR